MSSLKRAEKDARTERERRLARLRQLYERARITLRESFAARRAAVRSESRAKIETSRRSRKQLREDYSEIKRIEKQAAERSRQRRRKPAEAIRESDDEVRASLPPELLPVWERVKRTIKGTPHKSRTEAFLEFVEESPDDVVGIMDEAVDSDDTYAAAYEAWAMETA